jgi:hypothetical protein
MANRWEYIRNIKKLFWRASREGIILDSYQADDFGEFYNNSLIELCDLFPGDRNFYIRLWLADLKTWVAYCE